MKTTVIAVAIAALVAGGWGLYALGVKNGKTYMDVNVLVGGIKKQVSIEEKHTEFVWYRTCPNKISGLGKPPKILMVYPINFEFKSALDQAKIEPSGNDLTITLAPITIENCEPRLALMEAMASGGVFYQKGDRYIKAEMERAPHIVKYIAYQRMKTELKRIREGMTEQVKNLIGSLVMKNQKAPGNISINWDEKALEAYLKEFEKTVQKPPFGAKGCDKNGFYIGGKPYNYIDPAPGQAREGSESAAAQGAAEAEKRTEVFAIGGASAAPR